MKSQEIYSSRVQQATEAEVQWPQAESALGHGSRRPHVKGKFLYVGDEKFWIRGVTYGTFQPDESGNEFHNPEVVKRDFAQIAANGINAVRTYTPPPWWLLDLAWRQGLSVMVGLPWEQHVTFLDNKKTVRSIEARIREMVGKIAGHPALLCYVIGNEIPAPIVRWHGRNKIERFLKRLYSIVKEEDPKGLVTYVNYPTTEYLWLPFLDFVCFNVYLEEEKRLEAYLYRLQNIAGDRPIVMGEIGMDSRRNGEENQAEALEWQVRTAFRVGCAGVFVFAWTDEWYRGGSDIEDWDFGLTDRNRRPKASLSSVRKAFSEVPFPPDVFWPRISVVVCSYNGEKTIRECCEGIHRLDYPNLEVIVVDDGSTDKTFEIMTENGFRVIRTPNGGLSAARNLGLEAATGEIVVYLDDDAYPDPDWLKYLSHTFLTTDCVGAGGPNIPPPGAALIADCVANAPGGPLHVLISDREAEHIPGCNMAFRKDCLMAVGGFDPKFRAAGDDVDVCWRLQQNGGWLAFNPAAMVWHHRRNSVRAYWRQQKGYGKAEAMLERKWPDKYNGLGHLTWAGKIYGNGLTQSLSRRKGRIYHGTWGSAPFQSIYSPRTGNLETLPLIPEWYMLNIVLLVLSFLGLVWRPFLLAVPVLAITAGVPLLYVIKSAAAARFTSASGSRLGRLQFRVLTGLLHVLQPMARLYGRLSHGLTPWRRNSKTRRFRFPRRRSNAIWNESWLAPEERLEAIEKAIRQQGAFVMRGGDFDRWDLEVRGGLLGSLRTRMAIEEHGAGRQLVRLRSWPRFPSFVLALILLCTVFLTAALHAHAWAACAIFGMTVVLLITRVIGDCSTATATYLQALRMMEGMRPDSYVLTPGQLNGAQRLPGPVFLEDASAE